MHPGSLLEDAAAGVLPRWAEVTADRYEHLARVAALMDEWVNQLGGSPVERIRWRGAAWLHDALRDAPAERLLPWVSGEFRNLPVSYMHGPAAAARLEADGLDDEEVLEAIRFHTLGHAGLGRMGLALIAADFLEPGRVTHAEWRAGLRERMPLALHAVVREVVRTKLTRSMDAGSPIRPEMVDLWNRLMTDDEAVRG